MADLKAAMKAGEAFRRDTLRQIRSALGYEEIERQRPLSEGEVLAVLSRELGRREEAAEAYRRGGRPELALKEEREGAILREYLPEPVGEAEIREMAGEVARELGAGPAQMGAVMGRLMPRLAGRAEGREVARIVGEVLRRRQAEG